MSGHPTLTTAVYILIAVVFCAAIAYMFFYSRSVKSSKTDFIDKGEMAESNERKDAPAPSSTNKGNSGRPGTT